MYIITTINSWVKKYFAYVFFMVSVSYLVITIVKIWVADVCLIPSSSMEKVIYAGDRILVSKLGRNKIRRNDLIIFNHPDAGGTQLIKRCIGLPGDTVILRNGVVFINDSALVAPSTVVLPTNEFLLDFPLRSLAWSNDNYGPVVTPAKGLSVQLDSVNNSLYKHVIRIEKEEFGHPAENPNENYVFISDCYFVLGDNRGNSIDSRYWGFVPADLIVGKAIFVYFSRDREYNQIRWKRIGKRLNPYSTSSFFAEKEFFNY